MTVFAGTFMLVPMAAQAASGADLRPTAITFDQAAPIPEVQIHFDSGIQNIGDTDTGVFNIKWFVDGQEVGAYGSHEGVSGNTTVLNGNSQFDWTFDTSGTHTVTFTVDADNHVAESNEGNNSITATVEVGAQFPVAGWHYNNGSTIYDNADGSGLYITWNTSYVYPYSEVPLYWYASIVYKNLGNQILYFNCDGWDDQTVREYIQGPDGVTGWVAASKSLCSTNPEFVATLGPGRSFESWAIFHNVPWNGSAVAVQWGSFGQSPYVNPWRSIANGPPPSVTP